MEVEVEVWKIRVHVITGTRYHQEGTRGYMYTREAFVFVFFLVSRCTRTVVVNDAMATTRASYKKTGCGDPADQIHVYMYHRYPENTRTHVLPGTRSK